MLDALGNVVQERSPWLARGCSALWHAVLNYSAIDGEQRSASFAYYAFLSLFPLVLLLTTAGSLIAENFGGFDKSDVQSVIMTAIENYIPLSTEEGIGVRKAIRGFIEQRGTVGLVALLGVIWTSLRFFQALVRGVNRAWGTVEYSWWRLPIKNLVMVGIVAGALLLGSLVPLALDLVKKIWLAHDVFLPSWLISLAFSTGRQLIPVVVLVFGLVMFYMLAPRGGRPFRYVWIPAVLTAILLQVLQGLFVLYAQNYGNFNAIYGAFGGAIALLMWVYFSGSVIIFGGCLCAVLGGVGDLATAEAAVEQASKKDA